MKKLAALILAGVMALSLVACGGSDSSAPASGGSEPASQSSAGGGAVKVTATGGMRLTSLTIDPETLDPEDVEMLQDMILAAVNDALESAEQMASQQMGSVTGGLNIPGLF